MTPEQNKALRQLGEAILALADVFADSTEATAERHAIQTEEPAPTSIDPEALRARLNSLSKEHGRQKVIELVGKFSIANATPEQLAEVSAKLDEAFQ